jgi:uroporphyrinogen decarboxylase
LSDALTSRERVARCLRREPIDRVPFAEMSIWSETLQRWREEGLPAGADPLDYLDLDLRVVGSDFSLLRPERVIEDHQEWQIVESSFGVIEKRWKSRTGVPEPLEYPVKDWESWLALKDEVRARPERLAEGLKDTADRYHEQGRFVCFSSSEPAYYCNRLMGFHTFALAWIEAPELLTDIMDTFLQQWFDTYEIAQQQGVEVDGMWTSGDLGFRNGPLMSPRHYVELVKPQHRKMCDFFAAKGKPVIWHCCGDVRAFIPHLAEEGIKAIHPLEARAGNDVRELAPRYGDQVVLIGNIPVEVLSGTKEQIEEEIASKIPIAKKNSGYMFASDHSVPYTVSLENYLFAIEMAKKYGAFP